MTDDEIVSGAIMCALENRGVPYGQLMDKLGSSSLANGVNQALKNGLKDSGPTALIERLAGVQVSDIRAAIPAFRAGTPGNLISSILTENRTNETAAGDHSEPVASKQSPTPKIASFPCNIQPKEAAKWAAYQS